MKILFVGKADGPDYQCDMVMHGGRKLFGEDFVDANRPWYMYKAPKKDLKKIYGKGFTIYGLLENVPIDRDNIRGKILDKFYDLIVYGSVHRDISYWDEVSVSYDTDKIVFIDGEDHTYLKREFVGKGIYFKRELTQAAQHVHPINFSIPAEHIVSTIPVKTKTLAAVIPGDINTYIFDEQEDYYYDYRQSYFGVTTKKGGWDCCRHYEILLNGCIPKFPDLDQCPEPTMVFFPKKLVMESNKLFDSFNESEYNSYCAQLLTHTKTHLTTEALFNYILGFVR